MARYAPLPSVSLDPRNEAEIVQAASQRVYQASGQTLNDFSSGNPLAALLEGQAFAQGEFLFWANQLPQSILLEWIGPFLGAMRRLGTPSVARLLITVSPSELLITIPAGTAFITDATLTGGEQFTFITDQEIVIPPGETSVFATVISQYVGALYNAPANSITSTAALNIQGLQVTNPQPAVGGSDVETYQETQERFFTLIRRRNPVSQEDWQDFFTDFYGVGTQTSVQPNRASKGAYNYLSDYLKPNGQVSFFVLGPGGVELNQSQLERGQNVINYSVPIENQGHLYPITLSQVQYNITVSVNANGEYGSNLRNGSLDFRDRLFAILTPGSVFPTMTDPSVSDVNAAFYSTFPETTRFVDPQVELSAAYNTPPFLEAGTATYTNTYPFDPSDGIYLKDDLVETLLPLPTYYPVLTTFTPYSSDKKDQTIYNNLKLQQILFLGPGDFLQGQVCYWDTEAGGDGSLHVIAENVSIGSQAEIPFLLGRGIISAAKTYSAWVVGNNYQATTSGGFYDPEIIEYDYVSDEFIPDPNSLIPLNQRPGAFIWVVNQNFTLQPSTNNITGALGEAILGAPVIPQQLQEGSTYAAGSWVYTPQIGPGPNPVADPYYNYVDPQLGVVNQYAYVVASFTYTPNGQVISDYFEGLIDQGAIERITVRNGDAGLPVAKYNPRFPAGTYLEYRVNNVSQPQFYIAAQFFTPDSVNAQDMINQGLIFPLTLTARQYDDLVRSIELGLVKAPVRMFRFFEGDRTFFREGSSVISYTATSSVHPLFDFSVYLENGIFVETNRYTPSQFLSSDYIPYFNPEYVAYSEDTIIAEDGRNLYRVMRAFTPPITVVNWTNTTVANTARYEEYAGNLLRYVNKYECDENIVSQLGRDISAIKLGVAQITMVPKNSGRFANSQQQGVFVWENTASLTEVPQLSFFSGTSFPYSPPDYGDGTMRL